MKRFEKAHKSVLDKINVVLGGWHEIMPTPSDWFFKSVIPAITGEGKGDEAAREEPAEEVVNVPALRIEDGVVFASSLDVAATFKKEHRDVVNAIKALEEGVRKISHTPSWFVKTTYVHPQNKQQYPAFDMTRDGFALLAMGFTGTKALRFKVAYIREFNRMEEALRAATVRVNGQLCAAPH